ncbi:SufE family protein [Pelagibacteraceae bacterium]|nr:SufE family protein [Pelagibacteraceae bacterium]
MKTIEEKINYYKESLDLFDDGMDKYKFLIDQAKNAKNFPEEFRNDTFKVSGCQAQVWLVPRLYENKLSFYYDSDAFISKGMVTILCDIYGDRNPQEIKNSDFDHLNILELDTLLTPGRRNGVYSMLEKIKEYAKSYSKN